MMTFNDFIELATSHGWEQGDIEHSEHAFTHPRHNYEMHVALAPDGIHLADVWASGRFPLNGAFTSPAIAKVWLILQAEMTS